MKLTETQTENYIQAFCPPEYRNPQDEQRILLQHRQKGPEAIDSYRTISESEVNAREAIAHLRQQQQATGPEQDATIYIPVHCPSCRHRSWYEITPSATCMVGLNYLPAVCRNCDHIFLPINHTGHFRLLAKTCLTLLLFLLLIISTILYLIFS